VRTDGEVRDVRAWGEYVDDARRGDSALRGVFQDITERKAERREHRELAEEYEALLETSGDAIFLLDVDTAGADPSFEFARLSPGYETQTGLTTDEVRGKTPRDVFGDEQGAELETNYARCVDRGAPISYREELDVGDDARFWETNLAPVVVDGETVRVVGITRNVTEQVERERELEATNQRLESLVEATPLTVMEIDTDGAVIRWNDEAERMFGWSREEVLGEFNPIVPDEQQAEFASHRQRALSGERIRAKEIRRETKDGDELDLLLSVAPITDSDGDPTSILAVLEDITEQKELEARLRSLQETAQQLSGAESERSPSTRRRRYSTSRSPASGNTTSERTRSSRSQKRPRRETSPTIPLGSLPEVASLGTRSSPEKPGCTTTSGPRIDPTIRTRRSGVRSSFHWVSPGSCRRGRFPRRSSARRTSTCSGFSVRPSRQHSNERAGRRSYTDRTSDSTGSRASWLTTCETRSPSRWGSSKPPKRPGTRSSSKG
jgi:PAS domain S-box-containing protein